MRKSTLLHKELRDAIDEEIAQRVREHQKKIAALKSGISARMSGREEFIQPLQVPVAQRALCLLAHGDSWFDYPLNGNAISFRNTDVIAQLEPMGNGQLVIMNVSHAGDATTDEMSLHKQQRMIEVLKNPANWLGNGPDAILFSGGGNDIAGDKFCIYLDYRSDTGGLDNERFEKALGAVEASYLDLFAFRDRYAPGVPIIAHTYDWPIPNNVHPVCSGPWLHPSLEYCGWDTNTGTLIVKEALQRFQTRLKALAAVEENNFIVVETQGTLLPEDWANELHPEPTGFKEIAKIILNILAAKFTRKFDERFSAGQLVPAPERNIR